MLERGVGLTDADRMQFRGREVHPERLPAVALALNVTSELLAVVEDRFADIAEDATSWSATSGPTLAAEVRKRLEGTRTRHVRHR